MSAVIWERSSSVPTDATKRYEAQKLNAYGWKHVCSTNWLWWAKWQALCWYDLAKAIRIIDPHTPHTNPNKEN